MLTKEAVKFIQDLEKNNATEWMHNNKDRYQAYKKDYHNFIEAVLMQMKNIDPALAELEIKNCTFRINRDIRFSKNKQPYKTNIAMWLPTCKFKNAPGYYVHFEKNNSFIAGGIYCPEPSELKKIRKEINFFHDDLNEILCNKSFVNTFQNLSIEENNKLKKAPKDFDPNHPAIEILKLKSFTTSMKKKDDAFFQKDFAQTVAQELCILKPLNDFLRRAIETED